MKLEDFVSLTRQRWVGMTLTFLIALTVVGVWTETRPKLYAASASGIVTTTDSKNISESYSGSILAQSLAKSYVMLFTSRNVAQRVIDDLDLRATPEELITHLTATLPTGTVTVTVRATAPTPEQARDIANATVAAAAEQIREIQGATVSRGSVVRLVPVEPAGIPTSPAYPSRGRNYGLGTAAGLLLALGWGLVRERTDTRLRRLEQIEAISSQQALGVVPTAKALTARSRLLAGRSARAAAESFRQMRTNLRFVSVDAPPRSILVTSSVAGEGKSTVAANLARVIASGGESVILIDADLRRPTLHTIFEVDEIVGLTQVLAGTVSVEAVMQVTDHENLKVVTAGRIPHNPSELLGSQRMKALIDQLARDHIVIIDTPPLLPVTDASLLAGSADGALVVCRTARARKAHLQQSLRNLEAVDGRLLGLVINGVNPGRGAMRDGYGYYAGAGEAAYESTPRRRGRSRWARRDDPTEMVEAR